MTLRKKVSAIIFNEDGDILLGKYCPNYQNRSKLDNNSKNNKRTFPGGAKETKEKFRDALYRELYEEVVVEHTKLYFVFYYKYPYYKRYQLATKKRFGKYRHTFINGKKQRFFVLFYSGRKEKVKIADTNEFCHIKRVNIHDIDKYIDTKILKFLNINRLNKIIKKYLANRG